MISFKVGDKVRVNYSKFMHLDFGPRYHNKIGTIIEISSAVVVKLEFNDVPRRRCSIHYLERFPQINIGDRVRCAVDVIKFVHSAPDHLKDDIFIVDGTTRAYYQWAIERGDYELLPPLPQYFVLARKWMPNNTYDSQRWYSNSLAECIVYAQMQVEENGRETATVHQGEQISSLFIAARDLANRVNCIKSAECTATTTEIADALRKYVNGELGV